MHDTGAQQLDRNGPHFHGETGRLLNNLDRGTLAEQLRSGSYSSRDPPGQRYRCFRDTVGSKNGSEFLGDQPLPMLIANT